MNWFLCTACGRIFSHPRQAQRCACGWPILIPAKSKKDAERIKTEDD
jgi:DNA-directed RNA polymerase subunit RPC12/RpoP